MQNPLHAIQRQGTVCVYRLRAIAWAGRLGTQ